MGINAFACTLTVAIRKGRERLRERFQVESKQKTIENKLIMNYEDVETNKRPTS